MRAGVHRQHPKSSMQALQWRTGVIQPISRKTRQQPQPQPQPQPQLWSQGWTPQVAAANAAAVAVALLLNGSLSVSPAAAAEQLQPQPLCPSQPVGSQATWDARLMLHHVCPHRIAVWLTLLCWLVAQPILLTPPCNSLFACAQEVLLQQQQHQQSKQWRSAPSLVQPLAELAGYFDNADPTDPFTLYGTNL